MITTEKTIKAPPLTKLVRERVKDGGHTSKSQRWGTRCPVWGDWCQREALQKKKEGGVGGGVLLTGPYTV